MPVAEHDRFQANLRSDLQGRLTVAEDALRAVTCVTCMIEHDPDGSWIDTEAPARIAEDALERIRNLQEALRDE